MADLHGGGVFSGRPDDDFKLYLDGLGLSPDTVQKRCKNAKQFFKRAVKARLITSNPFQDVKAQGSGERDDYFVTREMTDRLIAACPDTDWKLILLLCRYGGLRWPSEVLRLRWIDIDFDLMNDGRNGRFIVHSPKTEHIPGKEARTVPLFPELRPMLKQVYDDLEGGEGTEFVITRYRHETNSNLRTQFNRIIRKAGLSPWPKLFHSLRKSRETELIHAYGLNLACAWIGNTPAVASKNSTSRSEKRIWSGRPASRPVHCPS